MKVRHSILKIFKSLNSVVEKQKPAKFIQASLKNRPLVSQRIKNLYLKLSSHYAYWNFQKIAA